jgi:hypothetical protein
MKFPQSPRRTGDFTVNRLCLTASADAIETARTPPLLPETWHARGVRTADRTPK